MPSEGCSQPTCHPGPGYKRVELGLGGPGEGQHSDPGAIVPCGAGTAQGLLVRVLV